MFERPSFDSVRFIPRRESLHCRTQEDPYRVAWEAAGRLPVPQAIAEVAQRCGLPAQEASLLVFCELTEPAPVLPASGLGSGEAAPGA